MQQNNSGDGVLDIPPGTKLKLEESAAVEELFSNLVDEAAELRGDTTPTRYTLRNSIGRYLEWAGSDITYEAAIPTQEHQGPEKIFDIVANEDDWLRIVEIKDTISSDELDDMQNLLPQLRTSGIEGKLYLATDIFNGFDLVSGRLRDTVNRLMSEEGMGVILADEMIVVICDNYDQLMMDDMPTILFGLG